jgi:hypothetical protein
MTTALNSTSTQDMPAGHVLARSPTQRFSADELACIEHALDHLKANKIAEENSSSGWYRGNRDQFVKRHKKALAVLRGFLGQPEDKQ